MKCCVKGCKSKAICWKDTKGYCDEHNPFSKKKMKDRNKNLTKPESKPSILDLVMSKMPKK